jgi:hypothetical protein
VTCCFSQRYPSQAVVKRANSKIRLNSHSKPHPPQTRATHLKRLYRDYPPEMPWLAALARGSPDRVLTFLGNFRREVRSA